MYYALFLSNMGIFLFIIKIAYNILIYTIEMDKSESQIAVLYCLITLQATLLYLICIDLHLFLWYIYIFIMYVYSLFLSYTYIVI